MDMYNFKKAHILYSKSPTCVGGEDDGVKVVPAADDSRVAEEQQAAERQLRQTHRVHHRVRLRGSGGQVSEVHRTVVACMDVM